MKFVVLFFLLIIILFFVWWLSAGLFKKIGKVVNEDVEKFKSEWRKDE